MACNSIRGRKYVPQSAVKGSCSIVAKNLGAQRNAPEHLVQSRQLQCLRLVVEFTDALCSSFRGNAVN